MACARRRVSATSSTHRLVGAVNSAAVISRPAINPRGASVREVLLLRLSAKRGPVLTARLTPPVARRPPLLRKGLGRRHFSGSAARPGCFEDAAMGLLLCCRARQPCKQPDDCAPPTVLGRRRARTHAYKYVSAPQQPRHYYPWTSERRALTAGGYTPAQ